MKIYRIITISLLALCACNISFAQEWMSVQQTSKDGKHTHQSYLTNMWQDNLFVGGGAGISTRFTAGSKSDIARIKINPDVNVFVLKWFTPEVGVRLGYQGFNGREGLNGYNPYLINHTPFPYKLDSTGEFVTAATNEPGVLHYGSMHLHMDFLWNITNTFGGFKAKRFCNVSAYVAGGYLRLFDNKTQGNRGLGSSNYDQEFALGAGAYVTFRITDRLVAYADLRYTNHASRYRSATGVRTQVPALSVGVAYNLYRTYWTDVTTVATTVVEAREAEKEAREMLAESEKTNESLNQKVEKLSGELAAAKLEIEKNPVVLAVPYHDLKQRAEAADLVLYFYINEATLNFSELHHLDNYVKATLAAEPDHVFHVTGSADKGTGSEARNQVLSTARANYVRDIIVNKFGVKPENVITSAIVTDKNIEAALDRCALIEK